MKVVILGPFFAKERRKDMAEQRKDNKGRLLRFGESQRKDGRYCYQYIDILGNRRSVYSWRLTQNDRVVSGKKADLSLREKEAQVHADLFNQIVPDGGKLTVLDLVEKYVSIKENTDIRESTKAGYRTVISTLKKDEFGKKRIDRVKVSDAKMFLVSLQKEKGKGFSTVRTVRGVLRPAFKMAYDDDIIKKNPFAFELKDVVYNDSVIRDALTRDEEKRFLEFVKNDNHFCKYYDGIYILLNTGLRISEFVGLTKRDIDFKKKRIHVNHQLQRYAKVGYQIVEPKTEAGERYVPMTQEVIDAFKRVLKNRQQPKIEPMIGGLSGFIFLDKDGNVMVANHWEKYFQHICEKYNKIYRLQLPAVTPHVCRHTFCSRMAAKRMNPKTLQYIMGHSDISVTLNVYTHVEYGDVEEEVKRVYGESV